MSLIQSHLNASSRLSPSHLVIPMASQLKRKFTLPESSQNGKY